jgi:glycosidase
VPNGRYSTFVRNHDQTRTVTALTPGAASANDAVARAKVAATLLLTLPGMPFVYYGEEIGMTGDKPDELLRTPMQWSASANAGFTTARPWQALAANWQTTNVTAQETEPASLLALHRKLINLRARTSALASGDFVPLVTSSGAVAAYLRRDGESVVLVVVNLAGSAATPITLTAADSVLAAGTYRVTSLIGGPVGAPLTVASDGRIRDYAPLGSLGAREGYVFALTR